MKCYFEDCNRPGEPCEYFEFYVCRECCEELERLIAEAYRQRQNEGCWQELTIAEGTGQKGPVSYSAAL